MSSVKVYVDFNNIAHMAWYPAIEAHRKDPERYELERVFKGNLEFKLKSVSDAILRRGILDAEFVFVKDEYSTRKILLYPQYKETHGQSKIPFQVAIDFLKEKSYGQFCYSPDNEADDAIAALVHEDGGVVVSMDKDLWQLLNERNTLILNPLTKQFITEEDVFRVFRVNNPVHIVLHKTLWGDAGDCVPNAVPRMHKHLLPIIRECDGTLTDFSDTLLKRWDQLSDRCKKLYADGQEQVYTNYELVKLDETCPVLWD